MRIFFYSLKVKNYTSSTDDANVLGKLIFFSLHFSSLYLQQQKSYAAGNEIYQCCIPKLPRNHKNICARNTELRYTITFIIQCDKFVLLLNFPRSYTWRKKNSCQVHEYEFISKNYNLLKEKTFFRVGIRNFGREWKRNSNFMAGPFSSCAAPEQTPSQFMPISALFSDPYA